jgi:hypothetical protein
MGGIAKMARQKHLSCLKSLLTLSLEGVDDSHHALSSELDPADCYLDLVNLPGSERCCTKGSIEL